MSPRKKIYFWLLIFILISLFFIAFLIPKFLKEIRANSQELISLKSELASFQKETENLQQLSKTYQNYQKNLAKIDQIFIDPEVPIEFSNFLYQNATLSQLKIEISPASKREIETESSPSLLFQISIHGSFPNFLKFLEKLENAPYLIDVLNLNIKKITSKEIQPADIESTFLIKVYTKK
jgi:Tfp pilus assembly protein PilO